MSEDLDKINKAWERSSILDAPATEMVAISEAFESGKAMYQSGRNDLLVELLTENGHKEEPPCDGCSECWTCGGGHQMFLRDKARNAHAIQAAVRRQLVVAEERALQLAKDLHAERERHQNTMGQVDSLQEQVADMRRQLRQGYAEVPRLEPWIYDRTRTPEQTVRLLFGGINIEIIKGFVRAAAKAFHIDLEPHGVRSWVRGVVGNLKQIRDARGPYCGHASSMLASMPDDLRTEE